MPLSPSLSETISAVRKDLAKVIEDLQSRPDYGKSQAAAVATFESFDQELTTLQANSAPTAKDYATVQASAQDSVLPLVARLINDNVAITKMMQLNTQRSITPAMAKAHTADLKTLQSDGKTLVAELAAEGGGATKVSAWPPQELTYGPKMT
ncbi:hypothetical protein AY600_00785 [Phormidium willei BDU 130791]|nr:hypothetical protein AY600_00785 [Phormidium willei BDU 130791]